MTNVNYDDRHNGGVLAAIIILYNTIFIIYLMQDWYTGNNGRLNSFLKLSIFC